jgi:RHS repeat-associated protein
MSRPARSHRGNSHRGRRRFSSPNHDGRYYRARYYHPGLQRFISEDPIGFGGGDFNLYAYVFNDPILSNDPTGEIAPLIPAGVACGAGALGGAVVALSGRKPTLGELTAGAAIGCGGGLVVLGGVAVAAGLSATAAVNAAYGVLAAPVVAKGAEFFARWASRAPFDQAVRPIGRFTEFAVSVPGRVAGSYTRWVKVVNQEGRTIRLYHDTYDAANRFLGRGIKVPGPERHVP